MQMTHARLLVAFLALQLNGQASATICGQAIKGTSANGGTVTLTQQQGASVTETNIGSFGGANEGEIGSAMSGQANGAQFEYSTNAPSVAQSNGPCPSVLSGPSAMPTGGNKFAITCTANSTTQPCLAWFSQGTTVAFPAKDYPAGPPTTVAIGASYTANGADTSKYLYLYLCPETTAGIVAQACSVETYSYLSTQWSGQGNWENWTLAF